MADLKATNEDAVPVGLDFGTSNTVVSGQKNGSKEVTFVKSMNGDSKHGSVVYYSPNSKEPNIYGTEALAMLPSKQVIEVFKRATGVTSSQIREKGMEEIFNAEIKNKNKQRQVQFKFTVDGKEVVKSSKDVMVDYLKNIKRLADAEFGDNLKWVVSRPQKWNVKQTGDFEEALEEAGIGPILEVITEPMAAAYVYSGKLDEKDSKRILVDDFGAGTLDVVLLQNNGDGNYKSVCVGGDAFLGGTNVDEIFLKVLKKELEAQPGFNERKFIAQKPKLKKESKELKHNLSRLPQVSMTIFGITDEDYVFTMDQAKKKECLKEFYQRKEDVISKTFDTAVEGANEKYTKKQVVDSVKVVALVGGANRDRYHGDELHPKLFPNAKIFGRADQANSVNADEAVSVGNTLWAAALMQKESVYGLPPKPVHAPVLSQSIGVEVVSGYGTSNVQCFFNVIIPAMTGIPTREKDGPFSTCVDDQNKVIVEIYQGEGRFVTDDDVLSIGRYEVPLKLPNKIGVPKIEVEMEITKKNTLIVRAGEIGEKKVEIKLENIS